MKIINFIFVISIFFLLNACSPQYTVVKDFIPPTNGNGSLCIKQCHKDNIPCQNQCKLDFNHCLALKESLAHESFHMTLSDYYDELDHYQHNLEFFYEKKALYQDKLNFLEHQKVETINKCESKKISKKKCSGYKRLKKKIKKLHNPQRPVKPYKPTIQKEIAYHQKSCKNKCQCDTLFEQCYISCGGEIKSHSLCIANCK